MIDRCVYEYVWEEVLECLLYGFVDVSKKVYCVVIYFVYWIKIGLYLKMLIFKMWVVLFKELFILWFEFIVCLIFVKLMCIVKNVLNL